MKIFTITTEDHFWEKLEKLLIDKTIISYQLPIEQSLECTWRLYINLDDGTRIEFFSEINSVDSWNEFGVLRINVLKIAKLSGVYVENKLSIPFNISSIGIIRYKDVNYATECGVEFKSNDNGVVRIVSSPAPGAISIDAFFNEGKYRPEFLLEHCEVMSPS
tara:strand:- start:1320 stop:1805 length:486 start_codon:yes stop_codon:yes gene_type:complete